MSDSDKGANNSSLCGSYADVCADDRAAAHHVCIVLEEPNTVDDVAVRARS